ncbi:MAG: hypothetical protein QW607_11330 [Desulfurococcaceae archaeon]
MRKKRLVKISAACAGLLLGLGSLSSVKSGEIIKSGNQAFSLFPGTQNTYKVAFEVYNPSGTATMASNTVIGVKFEMNEISNNSVRHPITVVFSFPDGDAKFSTSSDYRWVLVGSDNLIYAASELGAVGPTITLTSNNVEIPEDMNIREIAMPPGIYYLMQVRSYSRGPIPMNYIEASNVTPSNPSIVLEKHKASCTESPKWRLSASISGANGNIRFDDVTFAYVTPQFSATGPGNNVLNATLNGTNEYKTFITGSGLYVRNATTISIDNFISVVDRADEDWIVKRTGYVGNLTFDINSEYPVQGATLKFGNETCTGNGTKWTCKAPVGAGNNRFELTITGNTMLPMTIWTFSNAKFEPQFCLDSLPAKQIGSWTADGILEAIVPFVRYSATIPANTYLVFHNRLNYKVKVYAANMLEESARIINPTIEIGEIPPRSTFRIDASKLGEILNISEKALDNGVPIKFTFTAPLASDISHDPYIEGIVISVYAGEHRSVPLKFRQPYHGHYNE